MRESFLVGLGVEVPLPAVPGRPSLFLESRLRLSGARETEGTRSSHWPELKMTGQPGLGLRI